MDRVNILKSFWNSKLLQLDGNKLLLFTDYSQEVSQSFQQICQALFQNSIKFTLAYPATLRLTDSSGEQKSFTHPDEASHFMQSYLHIPMDTLEGSTPHRTLGPKGATEPSEGSG